MSDARVLGVVPAGRRPGQSLHLVDDLPETVDR